MNFSGGSGPILTTTTLVSSAQLLALDPTPVQLIPAPGVGQIVCVIGGAFSYRFGTVPYANTAGAAVIYAGVDSDAVLYDPTDQFIALLKTPANSGFLYLSGFTNAIADIPGDDNEAIQLASNLALTNGDGTLLVTIFYSILGL